jgi:FAD/FMN-containing dehydrogenase
VLPPAPSRLCGWGGATCSASWLLRPEDVEGIGGVFALARARGLSIGLRGAGQSYGDAALNGDNISLDLSRLDRILSFDPDTGLVDVEPGVTVRQLWAHVLPSGWWPAFTPGTSFATLGGCAAMNVHGKNHWKAGLMGDYIVAFDLLLPDGSVRRCTPAMEPELFHAAIGGFGMLGCFTRLTLQLTRVPAGWVRITPAAAPDLAAMVGEFEARAGAADFLVGWVDAFATGRALGRGLVHQATFPDPGEEPAPLSTLRAERQALPTTLLGVLPLSIAWRCARPFVNDVGVRCINGARWRTGRYARPHRQSLAAFSFPLDRVPDWRRAYGPHGLLQYQTLTPAAAAAAVYGEVIREVQRAGLRPYMGIFKRHRADAFLMSYGLDGYSLALDFKVTLATLPRLHALTGELDRLVIDAGGSFYFAKDMTLTRASYAPRRATARVQRFLALKRAVDPGGLLQTDLFRRVFGPESASGP